MSEDVLEKIREKAVLMVDAVVDHKEYKTEYVRLSVLETLLDDYRKQLQKLLDEFPDAYEKGSMPYLPLGSEWKEYFSKIQKWKEKAEKLLGVSHE